MVIFKNFRRWLRGSFLCIRCDREVYAMFFGFGKTICPDCYEGEKTFIFFDGRFWLNRIMANMLKQKMYFHEEHLPPIYHPIPQAILEHQRQT